MDGRLGARVIDIRPTSTGLIFVISAGLVQMSAPITVSHPDLSDGPMTE